MKHPKLMAGSIVAIVLGVLLWMFVGPAIMLLGIPSPVVVPVDGVPADGSETNPNGHSWSLLQGYSWLSYPSPSIPQISATYRAGLMVSLLGLCFLACGIIGIILAFTRSSVR